MIPISIKCNNTNLFQPDLQLLQSPSGQYTYPSPRAALGAILRSDNPLQWQIVTRCHLPQRRLQQYSKSQTFIKFSTFY